MKKLAIILFTGSMLFKCLGDAVITNEYWIEPSTNGSNLGTIGNPFYGNTQTAFDNVMSNYVTGGNVVIHLVAGTYQTAGPYAYIIGPNTTITGSGMDATFVHFALTNQTFEGVWQSGNNHDHVTVQDLTIDGNGSNNILSFGLNLTGNFETAKRVRVINSVGNSSESFGLALGATGNHDLVAEDCTVTNCLGTYGDAITVTGGHSCILNCRAYLPVGSWVGINCAAFNNTKIIGNHVEGGYTGFYMDSAPGDGILLEGNTFNGMNYAIQFNNASPLTNILILGNIIHLGTNVAYYPNHAIQFSGTTNVYSVQISHNIVVGNNTGRGDDSLDIGGIIGGIITDNTLDNRLTINVSYSTNVWMYDNVDQDGNYAGFSTGTAHTTPTSLPNPVEVTQISASTYSASVNDYFIGVQTTACTITLPYAQSVGSGKTYIVQDEGNATTSITISPQSGQLINGLTSKSITTKYGELTLISDGSGNWYAH